MRFLLVFAAVLVLAWRWRSWREAARRKEVNRPAAKPTTTDTVACRYCGVHLPAPDAVMGTLGAYCSPAHRLCLEP